ncbi:MAG: hypothetical protein ACLFS8_04715 [Clostridia bacterium]
MRVALVYNDAKIDEDRAMAENPHGIEQLRRTVDAVEGGLQESGHEVLHLVLPRYPDLGTIARSRAEVFFNLTTGIVEKRMQLHAVSLLEMAKVAFVGSDLLAQSIALDKFVTKVLWSRASIATPGFQLIPKSGGWEPDPNLRYPAIIKPCREGSSLGIRASSVVYSAEQARRRGNRLRTEFGQNMLLEELLTGREFTAGFLGNDPPQIFPIQEIVYGDWPADEPEIYSFEAKVQEWADRACPADIEPRLRHAIEKMCREAVRVLGLRDLARLDIRLDEEGIPNLLEVNALPGLQPNYSEYPRMAAVGGLDYAALMDALVTVAARRGLGGSRA